MVMLSIPVDISGTVVGASPDCLLLSGMVVGENPDHVCWESVQEFYNWTGPIFIVGCKMF